MIENEAVDFNRSRGKGKPQAVNIGVGVEFNSELVDFSTNRSLTSNSIAVEAVRTIGYFSVIVISILVPPSSVESFSFRVIQE